ncbi:MAG: FHA domain-containing protein [Candidatus Riflebacteria bacterium]|nr:FHA domain-containing protein [Candidatus Riflebacteria bacterium]
MPEENNNINNNNTSEKPVVPPKPAAVDNSAKTIFRKIIVTEELKKKFLVGNTAPYLGKPFEISMTEPFTIGREEGRTLQLPSGMVSRSHANIVVKEGACLLTDQDSSNGTFVNGERLPALTPLTLNHTDVIRFDTFEFIFVDTAVGDLWQTLKPLSREGSQIVSFYSPKGGTGITSSVVNIANILAEKYDKKVCVIDLDLRFGNVRIFVNSTTNRTIIELIQEQEIIPEIATKFLTKAEGFDFLAAPRKTELAELVNANHVKSIVWSLQAKYDYVLLDLKAEIDEITITAWEISNLIYLISVPEISHIMAANSMQDIMNTFKFPETKFKMVFNKMGRKELSTKEDVESMVKRKVLTLPYDPEAAILTTNSAQMLMTAKPSSPLYGGYMELAKDILGEETAAPAGGIFAKLKALIGM